MRCNLFTNFLLRSTYRIHSIWQQFIPIAVLETQSQPIHILHTQSSKAVGLCAYSANLAAYAHPLFILIIYQNVTFRLLERRRRCGYRYNSPREARNHIPQRRRKGAEPAQRTSPPESMSNGGRCDIFPACCRNNGEAIPTLIGKH